MIFISTISKVEYNSPWKCSERMLLSAVLAIFDMELEAAIYEIVKEIMGLEANVYWLHTF